MKIFFLCLAIILIGPFLLALLFRQIPDGAQPSLSGMDSISSTSVLSQPLIATDDNFSALGMSIKNPNLMNKEPVSLTIKDQDQVIRQVHINGSNIGDGDFLKLQFPPIPDSKNKTYTFELSSPTTTNELLTVFLSQTSGQQYLKNNQPMGKQIAYVAYYKPINPVAIPLVIYQTWFGKLVSDLPFFVSYLTLITILVGLLIKIKK